MYLRIRDIEIILDEHWNLILETEAHKRKNNIASTCPCLLADKQCHPRCSCVDPVKSYGCHCCTRYGSKSQRRATANLIVNSLKKDSK